MTGHDWQNHSPLSITLRDRSQRIQVTWTTNGVSRAQGPRETTAPRLAINDQQLTGPVSFTTHATTGSPHCVPSAAT